MTVIVTGRTWDHRDTLKALGGHWSAPDNCWHFDYATDADIARLRSLVGISVGIPPPEPPPLPPAIYGDDPRYYNYFRDQNPTAFFGFSSVHALADYVDALPIPYNNEDRRARGWSTAGGDDKQAWRGTPDMATALRLAREGWSDGIGLTDMFDIPHATNKFRFHSVAGGVVNVGRMLSHNPRHMVRRKKLDGSKVITLFVDVAAWHGTDATTLIIRALLIAGIIDVLETERYSCEIVAVDMSKADDGTGGVGHQSAITLKAAGEKLNLLDITFALGHPSFLRRLLFAIVGAAPECRSTWRHQGILSKAFDDDHRVKKNEFYIPYLGSAAHKHLTNDPLSLLPFIEPKGLPIKLRNVK